ncbi:hypothetical protein BBK36DRAFT_1199004 [Trichoderma citrinoviride]|uniref:WD40 repeat-like protein n=1 Tax=Trichoderma citrinoviride TaxID=58853 RepID=A0A2T4BC94_9HYPO|nr:hypothetical protein BBK36DRAFT_1199004 [Trichoderma citrinoviride]PTB66953.1 hypothetical protein BBK36DRAFT_1199004 [Trichoderma citrinoviride]
MPRRSISAFFKGLQSKSGKEKGQAKRPGGGSRESSRTLDKLSCVPAVSPSHESSRRSESRDSQLSPPGINVPAVSPPDEFSRRSVGGESWLSTPGGSVPAPSSETSIITARPKNDPDDPKDDEKKEATSPTSPQELWDEAYDQLKTEETKLLQMYEVILSNKLHDPAFQPSQGGIDVNSIKPTGDERRAQLLLVIEAGQKKLQTETRIKESMGEGMKVVNSMRYIITSAVQAAPQAALPWSLVTMSLDSAYKLTFADKILQNPLKQHQRNSEGISYTTKRMEWYWSLSNDLFNRAESSKPSITPDIRNVLILRLGELYKKIILYQVKSICSYYRNRGLQLFRELAMIRDLELGFQNDYAAYTSLENTSLSRQIKDYLEQQDRDCLRDLYITNPRNDRKRLLDAKGGLLPDSFNWKQTNLLWIKGDPELENMTPYPELVSYFFCQGTDPSFNNAPAVLRGLIYLLAIQRPSLISHLQEEYKNVGSRSLFDGVNAWDPALESACLVLDALDECDSGRKAPQVKWLLNNDRYVTDSVDAYVHNEALRTELHQAIIEKSSGTFLWAALVFKEIEELRTYDEDAEILELLKEIPSGLIALYDRMHRCRNLLATLPIMAALKDRLARSEPLKTLIKTCGSFLTVRDNVVYFIHQSAKDYLGTEAKPGRLRPNIYSLPYPGVKAHEYCCISWLRHFCDGFFGVDKVLKFVKTHLLHWIEVLSLLRNIQAGVVSLQNLVKNVSHRLKFHDSFEFFQDAARFILHNRFILETAPLQTYVSALIFSPTQSQVRLHFKDTLSWIKTLPKVDDYWSPCLNTLYASGIETVAFSSDSLRLTASFYDGRARSWDIATGDLIRDWVFSSVEHNPSTFSWNRKLLAASNERKTIVWDIESGNLIHEWECPRELFLATTVDGEFLIWDLSTEQLVRNIPCGWPRDTFAISRDFKLVATRNYERVGTEDRKEIQVSNIATGELVWELDIQTSPFEDVTEISKDFLYLVSAGKGLQVWHLPSGAEPIIIHQYENQLYSAVFSDDSTLMALGFGDGSVEVWSLVEKSKIGSYSGHTGGFLSMAFSADGKLLATASMDGTVKVWATDMCSIHVDNPPDDLPDNCRFGSMALSDDRDYVVYDSDGGNINVWHRHKDRRLPGVKRSRCLPTENAEGIPRWLWQGVPAISKDSRLIALECIYSASQFEERFHQIEVWDIDLRPCGLAFLPGGDLLAVAHQHGESTAVTVWKIETGELVSIFETSGRVRFYFHHANLCLATETGCYSICRSNSEDPSSIHFAPAYDFPGFGYYIDSLENEFAVDWVWWNGKGMIWLPVDFRPRGVLSFSAVASEVVIGTAGRDIVTMEFEEPPAELGDWVPWKSSGFL